MIRNVLLAALFLPKILFAQVEYIHNYNGDSEFVTAIFLKNSVLVGGNFTKKYEFASSGLLVELDRKGHQLWMHEFTMGEESEVVDILAQGESFVVLLRQKRETFIVVYDQQREKAWTHQVPQIEHPLALSKVAQNKFIIVGVGVHKSNERKEALLLVPMTIEGQPGTPTELLVGDRIKPYAMAVSDKSDLFIVGTERVVNGQEAFLWIFSKNGEKKEQVSLNEVGFKYPFDIKLGQNNDILIGGEDNDGLACLAKMNSNAKIRWKKSLDGDPGNFRVYSLSVGHDSIFAGGRRSDAKPFLIRFDEEGEIIKNFEFDHLGKAGFKELMIFDNQIMVVGTTLDEKSNASGYVIRLTQEE